MKFAILALVAVVQSADIADGADCAKVIDAKTKKAAARVKCKNAAFCCMACMPGDGAKKANKDAK
jgi:hypothetical protein